MPLIRSLNEALVENVPRTVRIARQRTVEERTQLNYCYRRRPSVPEHISWSRYVSPGLFSDETDVIRVRLLFPGQIEKKKKGKLF